MTATSTRKPVTLVAENVESLDATAKDLLSFFEDKRIITFAGNLGAGKTTLIKAICRQLGVSDSVSSPTFSIINEYRDRENKAVYHFDFYRLKSAQEAGNTGCADYFFSGNYCFIEWPELVKELLPSEYVSVEINVENEKRIITVNISCSSKL